MPLQEKHLRLLELETQLSRSGASDVESVVTVKAPPEPAPASYRRRVTPMPTPPPTPPKASHKTGGYRARPTTASRSTSVGTEYHRARSTSRHESCPSPPSTPQSLQQASRPAQPGRHRHPRTPSQFGRPAHDQSWSNELGSWSGALDANDRYAEHLESTRSVRSREERAPIRRQPSRKYSYDDICHIVGKKAALRHRSLVRCFRSVVESSSGMVSRSELQSFFRSLGLHDECADQFLEAYGANAVDYYELRNVIASYVQPGVSHDAPCVARPDAGAAGNAGSSAAEEVLEAELRDLCELIGGKVRQKYSCCHDCFRAIDLDNDGHISLREMAGFIDILHFPRTMAQRFFSILAASTGSHAKHGGINLRTFRDVFEPFVHPGYYDAANSSSAICGKICRRAVRSGLVGPDATYQGLGAPRDSGGTHTKRRRASSLASASTASTDSPHRGVSSKLYETPDLRGNACFTAKAPSYPRQSDTLNSDKVASALCSSASDRPLSARSWHPSTLHDYLDDEFRPRPRSVERPPHQLQGLRQCVGAFRSARPGRAKLSRVRSAGPTMTQRDRPSRRFLVGASRRFGHSYVDNMGRLVYNLEPSRARSLPPGVVADSQGRGRGARSGYIYHDQAGRCVHSLVKPDDLTSVGAFFHPGATPR